MATHAAGGLIVALRKGFHHFSIETETFTPIFIASDEPPSNRFNDGRTDRQGRFWCGSMDDGEKAPSGWLYRLDRDGRCERLVDGDHLRERTHLEPRRKGHVLRRLRARPGVALGL